MHTPPPSSNTALVVGATGATGRLLVAELLDRGWAVKAVVRTPEKLPEAVRQHPGLTVLTGAVLEMDDAVLATHLQGCAAIVSCLGHTLDLKGIFGPPRRLVTDSLRRLCGAARAAGSTVPPRVVLMSSAGVCNPANGERVSGREALVLALLRALVPPHADNEQAADWLRNASWAAQGVPAWVAVRPDTLIDAPAAGAYSLHEAPTRSALFNAGQTSRANVARFMAELVTDLNAWNTWAGKMPVIYNAGS